jgi:hypothetical protein
MALVRFAADAQVLLQVRLTGVCSPCTITFNGVTTQNHAMKRYITYSAMFSEAFPACIQPFFLQYALQHYINLCTSVVKAYKFAYVKWGISTS